MIFMGESMIRLWILHAIGVPPWVIAVDVIIVSDVLWTSFHELGGSLRIEYKSNIGYQASLSGGFLLAMRAINMRITDSGGTGKQMSSI